MYLQMANPDYATLLGQIAQEEDSDAKQLLIAQCYVFEELLTEEEKDLFNYFQSGYIEDNPGYVEGVWAGYIHKHYSDIGEVS